MDGAPRILLVDDGELDALPAALTALDVPYTRHLGGGEPLAPPREILIASARRAGRVRRGSPEGARSGRPLRVIAVEDDSDTTRRQLERAGFHLLVRLPAHPDVWRLLIERALYAGEERRRQDRVPVGSEISLHGAAAGEAFLIDISNRGCRILCEGGLAVDDAIELRLELARFGEGVLRLPGTVVRAQPDVASDGRAVTSAGVLFDPDLSEDTRRLLATLLNRFTAGPGSLVSLGPEDALPPAESSEFPGFTLDEETDPAVAANLSVELGRAERRSAPRASFDAPLLARQGERQRVLLGRDLSSSGMRVEAAAGLAPGQRFRLALYGPEDSEPTRVEARVERDDGDDGWMLAFDNVDATLRRRLEKIVACLPAIAGPDDGPFGGQLLSEILDGELD